MTIVLSVQNNGRTDFDCPNRKFIEKFGCSCVSVPTSKAVKFMYEIADYVNNELNDECLFGVE